MGMMEQILAPGVKDGEKPDFGAEMFGIGGNRAQGFCRGAEENAVHHFLVLVCDGGNLFRHRKNDMEVSGIEKLGLAVLNPLCASKGLALGAVPIAAAVVGNALVTAAIVIAFFDVAAEGRCPARLDRTHDAALGGRQRPIMLIAVSFAVAA